MPAPDLLLNVRKPIGWTSFDVVRLIKKKLPGVAVGHAGTLDPFAEGVLLICTGSETRRIQKLMEAEKEYIAGIQLGIETDTLDISGRIVANEKPPHLAEQQLVDAVNRFVGKIEQIPPRFSALKKDGKRWYELARNGVNGTPDPRWVQVDSLKILCFKGERIEVRIQCRKGTYVRALVRDFARALGTVGFTRQLIRTRIGPFDLDSSLEVTELAKIFDTG
ncbi:tRNA pseudouridine(55) synthase TruB [candidate division KSB1 bacterium]|nr:tRNA pseudouridine(55) synthase TruB [candidate division KSB1 bacterium]